MRELVPAAQPVLTRPERGTAEEAKARHVETLEKAQQI